jgi:CRISPR system Cascade subunit CasD
MSVLLLRLQAAMQSWGVQSRYSVRDTGREPSKSGVVGLLCAALGVPRTDTETVAEIASLQMGVRIDSPGTMEKDFHTALDVMNAKGDKPPYSKHPKFTVISNRYYLADAVFLVGLEGNDKALLQRLYTALYNPRWMLFLGRRAFVPSAPIWLSDGLLETSLLTALETYPWLGSNRQEYEQLARVRIVLEDPDGNDVRPDQPISFDERRFAPRRVRTDFIALPPQRMPVGEILEISLGNEEEDR